MADPADLWYASQQLTANQAVRQVGALWDTIDPDAIMESWAARIPDAVTAIQGGQLTATSGAQAYIRSIVVAAGETPTGTLEVVPHALVDSRELLTGLLNAPATRTFDALRAGASDREALISGKYVAAGITHSGVSGAGTDGASLAMAAEPTIAGFVRYLVPPSCSRCITLAGAFYKWNAGFNRHPNDDCVHRPVTHTEAANRAHLSDPTTDPRKAFDSMTPKQQDRAYGRADADKIRKGADPIKVSNLDRDTYRSRYPGIPDSQRSPLQQILHQPKKSREAIVQELQDKGFLRPIGSGRPTTAEPAWKRDWQAVRDSLPKDTKEIGRRSGNAEQALMMEKVKSQELVLQGYKDLALKASKDIDDFDALHRGQDLTAALRLERDKLSIRWGDAGADVRAAARNLEYMKAQARLPMDVVGVHHAPGLTAEDHLNKVLQAGKVLDDEIERRMSAGASTFDRAGVLARKAEARKQLDTLQDTKAALEEKTWQKALDNQRLAPSNRIPPDYSVARVRQLSMYDTKALSALTPAEHEIAWQAKFVRVDAQRLLRESRSLGTVDLKIRETTRLLVDIEQQMTASMTGALVPGTAPYAAALRETTLQVLGELRAMGGTQLTYRSSAGAGKLLTETNKLVTAMRYAETSYPTEWLQAVTARHPSIFLKNTTRGYNSGGGNIALSKQTGRGIQPPGDAYGMFQVATHELGHSMEWAVPGLKEMEWAYSWARSGQTMSGARTSTTRIYTAAKEIGHKDSWASHYTGRVYSDNPDANWEIFTTGVESLMSGSPYFQRTVSLGYDREFQQFILGVLSVL